MATPNPLPARRSPHRLARWADSLGTAGASLCAIHCALLPFALALLPMLGLGWLNSRGFEVGFVSFATLLASASLWHGYSHHRAYHAFLWLVPALLLLWGGVLLPALHEPVLAHAITMSLGGSLIALAHLANMRLSRGHSHGAAC